MCVGAGGVRCMSIVSLVIMSHRLKIIKSWISKRYNSIIYLEFFNMCSAICMCIYIYIVIMKVRRLGLAISDSSYKEITCSSPAEVAFFYSSEGSLVNVCTKTSQCLNRAAI